MERIINTVDIVKTISYLTVLFAIYSLSVGL